MTYAEILALIDQIVTGANYRASQMRPLLTAMLNFSTQSVVLTKAELATLIEDSEVNPAAMYRISDATAGVVLVFGLTVATISAIALNLSDGEFGTYVLADDEFTVLAGSQIDFNGITSFELNDDGELLVTNGSITSKFTGVIQ
jgi:hypothetical protein